MARPTKLTKGVQEQICRAVRAGNYPEVAAQAAGIAPSTFYRWMAEGRSKSRGPHHDFYETVKRAEAEGEAHAVAILRKAAGEGEWRAGLALLERRHAERWRRRERLEHAVGDQRPVLDLSKLSYKELATLERLSARAAKPE